MIINKVIKFSVLPALVSLLIDSAFAYRFTVTNMTDQKIKVIPSALMMGPMLHGWEGTNCKVLGFMGKDFAIRKQDNNVYIQNACALKEPYTIDPTETVEMEFSNADVGFCFDLGKIMVGTQKMRYSMMAVEVKALPNEAYNMLFKALSKAGGNVQQFSKAIGENFGGAMNKLSEATEDPETKAGIEAAAMATQGVGALGEAVGGFIDTLGDLFLSSPCKDMSFVAVPTKDENSVVLLTRQLGGGQKSDKANPEHHHAEPNLTHLNIPQEDPEQYEE